MLILGAFRRQELFKSLLPGRLGGDGSGSLQALLPGMFLGRLCDADPAVHLGALEANLLLFGLKRGPNLPKEVGFRGDWRRSMAVCPEALERRRGSAVSTRQPR